MPSYAAAMIGAILVGLSPIFVRATNCDPLTIAFYRLLFSIPLAGMWALAFSKPNLPLYRRGTIWNPKTAMALILGGSFFAFDIGLWNISLTFTSVVNATLFNNFAVFFIPLLCWALYKERLNQSFALAIFLALLGTVFLIGKRMKFSEATFSGDMLAIISSMSLACYYICIGNLRSSFTTGQIMLFTNISCAACLGFMAYMRGDSFLIPTLRDGILLIVQAAFIQIGGQGLVAYSLGKISTTFAGLVMLLAPISAAIAAWAIYGEKMSPVQILGMVIVLSSIALAKYGRKPVVEVKPHN